MSHPRSIAIRTLVLVAALLSVTAGADTLAPRHALLIGISDYAASGLPALPGAPRDLDLTRKVLQSRLGFQPSEIRILTETAATHTGIARAFAELAAAVAPGALRLCPLLGSWLAR